MLYQLLNFNGAMNIFVIFILIINKVWLVYLLIMDIGQSLFKVYFWEYLVYNSKTQFQILHIAAFILVSSLTLKIKLSKKLNDGAVYFENIPV